MRSFYSQKRIFVALLVFGFVFALGCGDDEQAEGWVEETEFAEEEAEGWRDLEEGGELTMAFSVTSTSSFPGLSTSAYAAGYCRSTANNTPVYTSSQLATRGAASAAYGPAQAYNATIYAADEVDVYSINATWAYVSYPTSSGKRYGYINTSDFTLGNHSETFTSKAAATVYRRPNGASYGSIFVGDEIRVIASTSGYYQVFYTAKSGSRAWKVGYVTQAAYNAIKGGGGGTTFNAWVNQMVARTSPVCNHGYCQCVALFNDYTINFLRKSFVGVTYAHQLYNQSSTAQWTKLSASVTPQAGDVVVWKAHSGCGYGTGVAGHVGVVTSVQANGQISVIHQNLAGDKSPRITAETKARNLAPSCLMGYLRPK